MQNKINKTGSKFNKKRTYTQKYMYTIFIYQ